MNEKIFISYSRDDKEKVFLIKEEIESLIGNGKCWVDITGIESDQQFIEVIIKAIQNCDIFLFMYSKNSEKSDWTKKEIDFAKSEKKKIVFVNIDGYNLTPYYKFCYGGHQIIDINNKDQKDALLKDIQDWCGESIHSEIPSRVQHEQPSYPNHFKLYLFLSFIFSIPMAIGWVLISNEQHYNIPLASFATIISIIVSTLISFCALTMTHKWNLRSKLCNIVFLISISFLVLYVLIAFGLSFIDTKIMKLNLPSTIIALIAIIALFLLINHKRIGYYILCIAAFMMCVSSYFWLKESIMVPVCLLIVSIIIISLFTFILKYKWNGRSVWEQLT